ncbi:MAG: hypothetical protein RLZZ598_715 [Pseudomonadota bacterium]
MSRARTNGVTLIELLVVVSIIGVLLALVGPAFKRMIELQRLRGVHNQIVTDLQFARSEALARRIPVHISVKSQTATAGACYIIFTDTLRGLPFSPECDCSLPPGTGCGAAGPANPTTEIRTVQLDRSLGIDLSTPLVARHGFDSESGALLLRIADIVGQPSLVSRFSIDSGYDSSRKYRAAVDFSGKVTTCAPSGSTVGATGCP